ncbi:MAG: OmpH family outer membrane protein [Bacteroidales bacterium]|nr:OmpH family outer membrane protein [Bacteroidales bacterium]
MKKLPLILSAVSIVAVIVLYILHFTAGKPPRASAGDERKAAGDKASVGEIVYIDIDSVLNGYQMYIDYNDEFERKAKISEAELVSKQKTYQKDVNDYQYKAQRGLITRAEDQQLQQELYAKQQNLLRLQQDLQSELAEQEQVTVNLVLNSITEYLKEIQPEYNYTYVFANRLVGGSIFYGNKELDITKEVIKGLNEKYNRVKDTQKK